MSQIKKIAICGAIQTGKSTLLERLLSEIKLPVRGFMTCLDRSDPAFPLYIYPAALPKTARVNSPENRLGRNPGKDMHREYTERFEELALPMISRLPSDCVTVMDELGFLESKAENFKQQVLTVCREDRYIIMVIKDRFDVPFLNDLRSLSDFYYVNVTLENRDRLYEELAPLIREWNRPEI